MKGRVIMIHGTMGSPERAWFPWLSNQLGVCSVPVIAPLFPTPQNQSLDEWFAVLFRSVKEINELDVLIGHSLGVAFVLRVLEKVASPVRAAYLVAGFSNLLGEPEYDVLHETFLKVPFDWNKLASASSRYRVYAGDNDPLVPMSASQELARMLNVKLTVVKGGGHLNGTFGYTSFQLLLDDLKSDLQF